MNGPLPLRIGPSLLPQLIGTMQSGGWFVSQEPHGRRKTVLSGRVTRDEVVQFSESELAQLHN